MMTRSRRLAAIAGTGLITLAGAALVATTGAAATPTVRYVSPTGTGDCSVSSPCGLVPAITASADGDVVELGPGTYPPTGAYTSTIENNVGTVITGEPGVARPVIDSTAPNGGLDFGYGSTISDLVLNYVGNQAGLHLDGGSASHVAIFATSAYGGPNDPACNIAGTSADPSGLTDSVCDQSAPDGVAIGDAPNGGEFDAILRGVTAVATGTNSVGIDYQEAGPGTVSATATDSIFKGTKTDVSAESESTGTSSISLSYSDYATTDPGTGGTITPGGGNVSAAPTFVASATENFAEAAGTPTIDKGSPAGIPAGDTDLAGVPRSLGSAPDIGAYEFVPPKPPQKPKVATPSIHKKSAHAVHVIETVNPEGLSTKVKLVVMRHGKTVTSKTVSAGSGHRGKQLRVVFSGLRKKATYRIRAVATSSAGHVTSKTRKVTTK